MAKKNSKAAKTNSSKSTVETINAGGGIMVDVISSLKANAAKSIKAKIVKKAQKAASKPQAKPTLQTAFREGSNYGACTIALANLGIGKQHAFDVVVKEVKRTMTKEGLAEFVKRDPKTVDARILTNLTTIGRTDSYGDPIRACGYIVKRDGRAKVIGIFKK